MRFLRTNSFYSKVIFFTVLVVFIQGSVKNEVKANSIFLFNEIKHDIMDYDEKDEILLFNSKATVAIGEKFTFSFTGIQNYTEEYFLYTWYTSISGIYNSMDFIMGNYTLNLGSGLIIGKKAFTSSDPFARRFIMSRDKAITPSSNGNPIYSLLGATADIHYTWHNCKISIVPFVSCQERYIKPEDAEEGFIKSSLATLNTKIHKQTGHEPVYIINYGLMASVKLYSLFTLQVYAFETGLKKADLSNIAWDGEKQGIAKGINKMYSGAMFLEYSDENISIFLEPAFSEKHACEKIRGYAIMYGMAFKSKPFDISFLGKSTDSHFQADYSAGNHLPENTWEIKSAIKAFSWLKTGFSIYSQNYLLGGYNKSYIEGTRREEISAEAKVFKSMDLKASVKSLSYYSDEYKDKKYQYILNINHSPFSFYSHSLKIMIQNQAGEKSQLYSPRISCNIGAFTFQAGFSLVKVSGDNYLYSGIPPGSGSFSSIYRFNESGHGIAAKGEYKKNKNTFYIRSERTKIGEDIKIKIESALALLF